MITNNKTEQAQDIALSVQGKACQYASEAQQYLLRGKYKLALTKAQVALHYSPDSPLIVKIVEEAQAKLRETKQHYNFLLPLLLLAGSFKVSHEN